MSGLLHRLYDRLPIVREIRQIAKAVVDSTYRQTDQLHLERDRTRAALLQTPRYSDPRHLAHFEGQTFSQHSEDGVTLEIFRRIGSGDCRFVEIGAGSGLENNTAILLATGWSGLWVEGSPKEIAPARAALSPLIQSNRLTIANSFVTAENVASILEQHGYATAIDFLSIDVDFNTYWIWHALSALRPRVVVVEYNAGWGAEADWKVGYDPSGVWDGKSMFYGASLGAFVKLATTRGYSLVGCELCGVNAYFVRSDLVEDRFVGPFTAQRHFEPFRPYLAETSGYARDYRAIPPQSER